MWFDFGKFPDLAQTLSAFTQIVTGHYYLKDYCQETYPTWNAHKCALTQGSYKPISEYNKMLTSTKRIYIPDLHDNLYNATIEMREIDDIFEVDGVMYDNVNHYDGF